MKIVEILQKEEVKQGFNLRFVQNIPKLYPQTPKIVFDDGEWNEDDHPRDENGMFTTGGGGNSGATVTVPRNYECRLAQKLGREHYDKLHDIIDKCPNNGLKEMWSKAESSVSVASTNSPDNYCLGTLIYINLEESTNGDEGNEPYQTVFHEITHAMDTSLAYSNSTGKDGVYSVSYNYNNGEFGKTIQQEYDNMIKNYTKEAKEDFKEHAGDYEYLNEKGYIANWEMKLYKFEGKWAMGEPKYSTRMVYKRIENEIRKIPPKERSDLSDIFDGCSKGKINGGYGHDRGYWKRDEKLGKEAFAEITSSSFTNPKSAEHIKRYFPKSYGVYEKIIDTYK